MTVFRFPMFFTVVNRDEKVLKRNPKFAHFLRERERGAVDRFPPLPRAAGSGHTPIGCDLRATGKGKEGKDGK